MSAAAEPTSLDCFDALEVAKEQLRAAQLPFQQQQRAAETEVENARARDVKRIKEEAIITGFSPSQVEMTTGGRVIIYTTLGKLTPAYPNSGSIDEYVWTKIVLDDTNQFDADEDDIYNTERKTITDEDIEALEFTGTQVHFLEWTVQLTKELSKFWRKGTPLQTIDEFINHQKNTCNRIFGQTTKRATSDNEGCAADASDTKRARTE